MAQAQQSIDPETIYVLIVEDDLLTRETLKFAFKYNKKIDTEITAVATLHDAINALREIHFQFVLLDLNLPDSTGMDTARSIRSQFPETPIIIFSAISSPPLIELQACEICNFVSKAQRDFFDSLVEQLKLFSTTRPVRLKARQLRTAIGRSREKIYNVIK